MAATMRPALGQRLLRASLAHIPRHGFTLQAAEAALSEVHSNSINDAAGAAGPSKSREQDGTPGDISVEEAEYLSGSRGAIASLFTSDRPSSSRRSSAETIFGSALFSAWDRRALESTIEEAISHTHVREDSSAAASPGSLKGKSKETDDDAAYEALVAACERRLAHSAAVQRHLLDVSSVSL